jgi:hypothetical protein
MLAQNDTREWTFAQRKNNNFAKVFFIVSQDPIMGNGRWSPTFYTIALLCATKWFLQASIFKYIEVQMLHIVWTKPIVEAQVLHVAWDKMYGRSFNVFLCVYVLLYVCVKIQLFACWYVFVKSTMVCVCVCSCRHSTICVLLCVMFIKAEAQWWGTRDAHKR